MTDSALYTNATIPFKNGLKTLFSIINATKRFSFLSIEAQKQYLKIVLIIFAFTGGNQLALGQTAGNYLFAASSGTFTPLSSPSTLTFTGSGSDRFMGTPGPSTISIGFTFKFENTNYTTFAVSENGWMTLGKAATSSSTNWLAGGLERPTIAPLYDDLGSNLSPISGQTGAGSITYLLTGTSPNRILTIQWLSFYWKYTASSPSVSFQVKLYETTNKIEFIYQAESGAVSATPSASIGIAGVSTGSGNFLSLDNTNTTPAASSSTETTTLSVKPATGQTYTFTPPPVIISSLASITNLDYCLGSGPSSSQSFTISGTNLTTDITVTAPVGFEVSKDNTTFASAISYTPSLGIVSSTTVFVRTKSGLTAGAKSGTLACTSTNASTQNISLSGTIKASVGGTVSGGGGSAVCPGANSNTLNLNGSTGAIQWQSSSVSDFSSSVTDISVATSTTYTATNIATTTYYRAKLTDGSCASAYSNTVVITTMAITSSASPICGGQDLTLSTNISSGAGITYSWTGPNSFTSTLASPTIPNISAVNAGTYSLTVGNTCGGVVDDFSDGNYTSNPTWTVQNGGFEIAFGTLKANAYVSNNHRIYTGSTQAYGSWQFNFQLNTLSCGITSAIRFFLISSTIDLTNTNGYYIYADGGNNFKLIKRIGATNFEIITSSWVSNLSSHTVKVERLSNGSFTIYLDGNVKGTITDNTYISSSCLGIWSTGCDTVDYQAIDNITCAASLTLSTTISVNASPAITSQSSNAQTLCLNSTPTALSITVTAGSGTISKYEWYSNSSNSTSGGTLVATYITSATLNSYTPVATAIGILYYYVIITNSNGCALTSAVSGAISVGGASTTWNGTTWSNGVPNISPNGTNAIIDANYNTGTNGSITACSCTVNSGKTLTVSSATSVTLQNQLTNLDTSPSATNINFADTSCLVQINDTPTTENSGVINYNRKVIGLKGYDYVYWSSPVLGATLEGLYNSTSPGYKYSWNTTISNSNGASGHISQGKWVSASGAMSVGKGYIVRASSTYGWTGDITSVFTGVPNNGIIDIPISRGDYYTTNLITTPLISYQGANGTIITNLEDNWNYIGNPYPTAIKALDFLTFNTNIEGAISLWTHKTAPTSATSPFYASFTYNYYDDYIFYNGTGTTTGPTTSGLSFNGYIAAGQGFFVNMIDGVANNSQTVRFNNAMRYVSGTTTNYDNTQFYRMSPSVRVDREKHRIWLDLVDKNNMSTRTLLGYVEGATLDKDRMYDAYNNVGGTNAIYTMAQGVTLIIQGRPLPFDENDQVPLGVSITQTGDYSIAIAAVDGLFENNVQAIYLKDNYLGVIHNLSQAPYRFTQANGVINDRFQIVYKNPSLSTTNINLNGVVLYEDNKTIYINSGNATMNTIKVYDILGRLLKVKNNVLSNKTNIQLENVANQIVLVQITDDLGKITTTKLIIK